MRLLIAQRLPLSRLPLSFYISNSSVVSFQNTVCINSSCFQTQRHSGALRTTHFATLRSRLFTSSRFVSSSRPIVMTGSEQRAVKLYVYDLSKGLARVYSRALLGRQIDAVYHTSIVIDGVEVYYGAGIQRSRPGVTHHGAPQEIIDLGHTTLPAEVIQEYLDTMREIYAPETYDLFMHNCNNFTDDFSMFLVGKGIPAHITSLPQDVLSTPFGQMLRPQIDAAMRPITTAPSVSEPPSRPADPPKLASSSSSITPQTQQSSKQQPYAGVRVATNLQDFERIMTSASKTAAVVFFTSASCPPCRVVYPHFEQCAEESAGKATFVKVDVSQAYDIGSKYQIRATPTFVSFVRGEKLDEWTGGHPGTLKSNIAMMLNVAYPPHPHESLRLPVTLSTSTQPITFQKVPPLDKVMAKLGKVGEEKAVLALKDFIATRQTKGSIEARLPDLPSWSAFLQKSLNELPPETLFPLVDLFRVSLSDPRVSGWYAEETGHATIKALLRTATASETVPYSLRLSTLQATCNLFTTTLFPPHLTSAPLSQLSVLLITSSILDEAHSTLRVAASSLAFNLAAYNQKYRTQSSTVVSERHDAMSDDDIVQLLASVVTGIEQEEESPEALQGLLLSLGLIVYGARIDGEVIDLVNVLEAGKMIVNKGKSSDKKLLGDNGGRLCSEVGGELLGKGLSRP